MPAAATSVTACTTGKSRALIDSTARRPMPGHEKTCSVITAPLTSSARLMPTIVTTGMSPFGAAWR